MKQADSPQSNTTPVRVGKKLGESFQRVEGRIRELAYQIFQGREPGEGDPMSDWLEAQARVLTPLELVVKNQRKCLVVECDLKGFAPEEIEIEVGAADLRVFGTHTLTKSRKKRGTTRESSQTVHFYQAVTLPCEVESATCEAKLQKNGKLKITLPKRSILEAVPVNEAP